MLNYDNLNDMEFESLCRDIMERKLGVALRRFAPGRDGGVDLADDVDAKNIVVQVKHYRNSTTTQLVNSLKNELKKVKMLAPQQYYICCSRELSVENIKELYLHFNAYMASQDHIITILEIDDFLKSPENRYILKKHFKLWLDDAGILQELCNDHIFVDCEAFLDDAENLCKLFVRTNAFDRALSVLENEQTLCIIGDPGVGKSITSKMLVFYYASQGYRVRYTSNVSDLAVLKASLRSDPDAREVILLDDCFGQAYFEMRSTQSSELISLIKYVKHRPHKVLILNSRVTIFQEAQRRERDLVCCLEHKDFKVHVLNINMLSAEEKAKILYNHLSFSDIPNDYFEDIKVEQRYRNIINHRNYNPRIIEFVCNPKRYRTVPPNRFYSFIQKHLDNPREIWKDEYDERLKPEDRIFLQTVYSLTNTTVSAKLVRKCFERRIAKFPTIDKTVDQFSRALERLNEGFIRIVDNRGSKEISMQNPSVNDFLDGRLLQNNMEREDLISSICAVKQLRLLPKRERIPYIVNLLQSNEIEQFIFLDPLDRSIIIGHCILASGLCINKYRPELLDYILYRHRTSFLPHLSLLGELNARKEISNTDIWNFYNLKTFFEEGDHLYQFLSHWHLSDGTEFICAVDDYFHGKRRVFYIQQVEKYLSEAIDDFCTVDASDYEYSFDIESVVHSATNCSSDDYYVDEDEAATTIDECVQEEVFNEFQSIISKLPEHFRHLADDIQEYDITVDGSEDLIKEFLSNPPGHYDSGDNRGSDASSYSAIDEIFQR